MLKRLTSPELQGVLAKLEALVPPWEGLGNFFLEPPAVCIGVREFEVWTDPSFYIFLQDSMVSCEWIVVPSGPLGRHVFAFDAEIPPHGYQLDCQSLPEDLKEMFNGNGGLNSWVPMRYYVVSLDFHMMLIGDRRWESSILVDLSGRIRSETIRDLEEGGQVFRTREKIAPWIWWAEGATKAAMVDHLCRWIGTNPSPSEPWATTGDRPD